MERKNRIEHIFVLIISIVVALFANILFILGTYTTPPDMIYLGVTHHYYDYFFYVSQVMQGTLGSWITNNLFTSEYTAPSILYWPNILLGHIGSIVHVSPITMFNVSVYMLCIAMLLSVYKIFSTVFPKKNVRLTAFLLFICSTSLLNRLPKDAQVPYFPFQLWGTPHLMMNRFTPLPHHMTQTLLFSGILFFLFATRINIPTWSKRVLLGIQIALLTVLQPILAGMMVGCYGIVWIFSKHKHTIGHLLALAVGFGIPFVYMLLSFQQEPHIQLKHWELTAQTFTTTWFLFLSIGPIVPYVLAGVLLRIKQLTQVEWFGLLFVFIGYILFRFPSIDIGIGISNARVLSAGTMVFVAWFGATGIDRIATMLTARHATWKSLVFAILLSLFFIAIAPTVIWEVKHKTDVASIPSPYRYIPKTTYDAFLYIKKDPLWQAVVLANPVTSMDTLVPALSGHQTYSGHPLTTIHSAEKTTRATDFFLLTMTEPEARDFVSTVPISYVLFTVNDGNVQQFQAAYPFLTSVYQTATATVFSIMEMDN